MEEDFRKKVEIGRKVNDLVQTFYYTPKFVPIVCGREELERFEERMKLEHPYDEYWAEKNCRYESQLFHYEGRTSIIVKTGDRAERMREELFKSYLYQHEDNDFELNPPINVLLQNQHRCCGSSTRLADDFIAQYFDLKPGEAVAIVDHYPEGRAHHCLAEFIMRRLESEYGVKPKCTKKGKFPIIVRTEIPGFDEKEENA